MRVPAPRESSTVICSTSVARWWIANIERPGHERILRWLLRTVLTRPALFGNALRVGRALRWAMPCELAQQIRHPRAPGARPRRAHARKVILLNGCTQPAMAPSIDAATMRVLDALGVQSLIARRSGCCGAIRQHLGDPAGALRNVRRNIDAWWPILASGAAEAIVVNASGCAATIKEYAYLLRADTRTPPRRFRSARELAMWANFLPRNRTLAAVAPRPRNPDIRQVVFQRPCTQQHGLKISGQVEACSVRWVPRYLAERTAIVLRLGRHLFSAATSAIVCSCGNANWRAC